jgi:osmotically inducible lipoprotein OsmB
MKTKFNSTLAIAIVAASLGGCAGMSTQDRNTAVGAAVGGAAGAVLTGGSAVGTVGGAVVGGVVGNKVDSRR